MTFLILLPAILSALTLAAHFLRNGHVVLTTLAAAIPFLFLVRRRWVIRYAQTALALGTLEWSRSAGEILHERLLEGQPYARMLVIMYGVAAFGALSALLLQSRRIKRRFPPPVGDPVGPTTDSAAR